MKKLYPFFAIALIGFIGNAQIINFPDPNFKAKLISLGIDTNGDGEIAQSEALEVEYLYIDNSNISDLTGLEYFTNLNDLSARYNQLTTFNLNGLQIAFLDLDSNNLTSVDFSGVNSLWQVYLNNNHLSSLSISSPNMIFFQCNNNNLSTIDLSGCTSLTETELSNNQLTSIVFPPYLHSGMLNNGILLDGNLFETLTVASPWLDYLDCSNNPNLKYLNIKDAIHSEYYFNEMFVFSNCPQLEYVCVSDADLNDAQEAIINYGYTNCHVNTYCSFTPGGTYYTIEGVHHFDSNGNGCDNADGQIPNMKYIISDGSVTTSLIANAMGPYHYDVPAGTYTITPVIENGTNFTISPASASVTFPNAGASFTQNFCTTANNNHNDLEISVWDYNRARPGFDTKYIITYRNKGTTMQNGTVSLQYYDPIEDLVSANPSFTSESSGFMHTLNWNFNNLLPFETRMITVIFNINSPVESPPVNIGNIIQYTATITGTTDETPNDNTSVLNQMVLGSYDPNDKTCTEGANLPIDEVGKYLHYIIRFENTGTANAENVVVKDMIDTTKFDISTLVPLHGSHAFETRISSTNKVEFIFENINLPFDNANNDGYVAFKIKTLPNLAVGNQIINSASIYFDYNAPIITDPYTVNVYNPLSITDFDFGSVFVLSPVPAKNSLTITTKQNVVMSSVNIYNTLGQLIQVNTNPSETIDVSGLKTGSYFIKIISDKGTASSKFVKE